MKGRGIILWGGESGEIWSNLEKLENLEKKVKKDLSGEMEFWEGFGI
jgi:hypothetical protein